MANSAPTSTTPAVQYRFRTGSFVSTWMSADQLKEAALRGELLADSLIQQAGHAEWVPATNVRGLTFPPPTAEVVPAPMPDPASILPKSQHPRFGTLRDLLAAYLNADIEINLPDTAEFGPAHVCAVSNDHFEVTLETGRSRVFVPYARIRVIWVTETSTSAMLTYRESHRITVEMEKPAK